MKKVIFTQLIFIIAMFLLQGFAQADPPGTGTVTQITDVSMETTMYMGKQYYVYAIAKDIAGNPVANTACSIHSMETTTGFPIDRKHVENRCLDDKECLPSANLPFECYYTTWGTGEILIPFYIDPMLYDSGVSYTFYLSCEDISVNSVAFVNGVSNQKKNGAHPHSCNVSAVKINDGADGTTDYFDENPNKLDNLYITYALDTHNTVCVDEEVRYTVYRDMNGTWLGHADSKVITSDINGTGIISLEIDTSYFVGGSYKVVVTADNKSDSSVFTVGSVRPYQESYETLDWAKQNTNGLLALIALFMLIIIGLIIIFKLAF